MRLAVQASDLDHQRIDGTRVYLKELLQRFGVLSPETDFLLYHRRQFNPSLAPPLLPNYQAVTLPFPYAWMQTRFAWELFRQKPDKLFLPIQAAPVVLPRALEVTATIHDVAFRRFPETFPSADRLKLNFMLEAAVRRADKLIAVSFSTKRDLLEFFPTLPEDRVRVIHHGFDGDFFGTRIPTDDLTAQLKSFNLQANQYILYVGALQPRKNLIRLMKAFEVLKKRFPEAKLVLAGEAAWMASGILKQWEQTPSRDDIVLPGRLSFEEVRVLYQGARLFAFPSLYEGFGLPILEAFASGVPVLTADNSSLREVAGDGALYCQAEEVEDIAQKLEQLWGDETLRRDLIAKSQEQIKQFSWDMCARETFEYIAW